MRQTEGELQSDILTPHPETTLSCFQIQQPSIKHPDPQKRPERRFTQQTQERRSKGTSEDKV